MKYGLKSSTVEDHQVSDGLAPASPAPVKVGRRLRVLVIDEELPYPPNTGKRVRTWNLLRRLAGQHEITLLCYGNDSDAARDAVHAAGISVHLVPNPPNPQGWRLYAGLLRNLLSPDPFSVSKHFTERFRRRFASLLAEQKFDLVQCEWTPYARFLESQPGTPFLVATHNVESQIWFRRGQHSRTFLEQSFFWLQGVKMRRFERRVLPRSRWVTAVTPLDLSAIREWGVRKSSLVENGVDLESLVPRPELENPREILFLGSMDWFPNQDAVEYFLERIFPMLRKKKLGVRFRIAGRRPSTALRNRVAAMPDVELVGEVADVPGAFAGAAVVVVPLRIGGGSRIKILEAMAMKRAVVSTTVGAEGLEVENGRDLVLANSPAEFADRVAELLAAPHRRAQLGENARCLVEQRYSWDRAAIALAQAWENAAAAPGIKEPASRS
jgi:glycosyltransferase involved in cell wall biosynthesis